MDSQRINKRSQNYTIPLNEFSMKEIPSDKFFRIISRLFTFHDNPSFELINIQLDDICPLTRHVYTPRLSKATSFMNIYRDNDIQLYKPVCLSHQSGLIQIVSPPIVEIHNNQYVLCDGTHRIYQAKHTGLKSIVVLAVKNTTIPLPGDVNAWQHIQVLTDEVNVEENFINFKREYLTGYTWIFNGEKSWIDQNTYINI